MTAYFPHAAMSDRQPSDGRPHDGQVFAGAENIAPHKDHPPGFEILQRLTTLFYRGAYYSYGAS
jgi:hypothetical protein